MNTPASSSASSVAPRASRLLDRLVPVSPQWRIPARKAERLGWLQLLLGVLVVVGAQMIVGLVAVAAGLVRLGAGGGAAARPGAAFIIAISAVPLALLGYWLVVRFVGSRPVIELGGRGAALRELLVGLAMGALLMCAVIAVLALLGSYHVVDVGWSTGILAGLQAGILAGFTEEILVRGVMLRLIEGWVGTWWALAVTAVFFGAAHLGNPQATIFGAVAIALEAGILLGACYLLTRRLWLAIGVHAAWNFVQGGIFGSDISGTGSGRGLIEARFTGPDLLTGGAMGIEASVVAVVLCTAAGLVMLLAVRRRGLVVPPCWRRPVLGEAVGDERSAG
ncbi:CPBP family intramembrane glutamic endopeptidase [Actinomyces oris]|uniref:Abortive infection protein n=1 Tax=Actinomyces oris TaxID=544580 RepID=A0A1Q8HZ12_9ACTO|nr:type II CAAX endopeptidase family protein [Actinomyces oris]OLL14092.1 abortive infection protein [Actinomyces oris]